MLLMPDGVKLVPFATAILTVPLDTTVGLALMGVTSGSEILAIVLATVAPLATGVIKVSVAIS